MWWSRGIRIDKKCIWIDTSATDLDADMISTMDEKAENAKKSELLVGLLQLPYNRTCADCGFIIGEGLVKANAALGVFICLYCSECHTAVLPLSICAIKSVDGYSMNMRLARWSYNEIRFMARWGNKRANAYWAATLAPNPLWGNHRFTSKIHRENHIKTKYKMKGWVLPRGVPTFTDFAKAELRILNDRGQGYRSVSQTRPAIAPSMVQTPKTYTTTVVSRALSSPPTPTKPSIKLPPGELKHQEKPPSPEDLEPENQFVPPPQQTPACGEEVPSVVPTNRSTTLPGVGWTEKWREYAGILAPGSADRAGDARLFAVWRKDLNRLVGDGQSSQMASSPAWAPQKPQLHYKVNIPPPSMNQMKMVTSMQARQQRSSARLEYQPSTAQRLFTTCYQTASPKPVATIITSIPPLQSKACFNSASDCTKVSTDQQSQSALDVIRRGLVSEPFNASSQPHRQLLPSAYITQTLPVAPPSFPFTQSTVMDTFPFHPTLPQNMSLSYPGYGNTPVPDASQVSLQTITISKKDTACADWNYSAPCTVLKDGKCQKLHVCEICESAEHRASQHWHHLATAPLPEIQSQPQLSSIAHPPDSPTILAIKDRVPLFVPEYSDAITATDTPKSPRVPLFVPPLGISGAQKVAAQTERLKLRKKNSARRISAVSVDDGYGENERFRDIIQPSRKSQRIKIMAPPTSPFDKPVEVILPPAVRPFKTKSTETFETEVADPAGGQLRVVAPAFEPLHVGAWSSFGATTSRFGGLFQIPGRESRRIEIVAPTTAAKEEAPQTPDLSKEESVPQISKSKKGKEVATLAPRIVPPKEKENMSEFVSKSRRKQSTEVRDLEISVWNVEVGRHAAEESIMDGPIPNGKLAPVLTEITSSKLDRSVLEILDEQLEAIIDKESEETIAKTLETIIEICSTSKPSSTTTSPRSSQFEQNRIESTSQKSLIAEMFSFSDSGSLALVPPSPAITSPGRLSPDQKTAQSSPQKPAIQANTVQIHHSFPKASHFFTLNDFADDDVFTPSAKNPTQSRRNSSQHRDESNRPRSSDSSSTTPFDLIGSPRSPVDHLTDTWPIVPVDQTPLRGRIERMMSCAAARGAGQCNCGLGDWFHHSRG